MEDVNALGSTNDQDVRPPDKETGLHDPGDQIQCRFQFSWSVDAGEMDIHDEVTGFGLEREPPVLSQHDGAFGERVNVARGTSPPEGNDFDRERE